MTVLTGADVLLGDASRLSTLRGLRVGVLCHQASVTRNLTLLPDALVAAGVSVERLFAPEHGLFGAAQDMDAVADETYAGIPVVSLYGTSEASLRPSRAQLDGLDLLICDLADVGSRYYTFVYTIAFTIEAAAAAGLRVLVLDRPNPLGGDVVEGNVLDPALRSFVGAYPLPVRHGLTPGELMGVLRARAGLPDVFEVVPAAGWRRGMYYDDTGLPWVLPSPNMPTLDTALVYPGGCLIEGTELSEGRGTTRPFELLGAPGIDPARAAARLTPADTAGAVLRPCGFTPTVRKHARRLCRGFQVHVTDRARFRPFRTYFALLKAIKAAHPDLFAYRAQAYEFVEAVSAMRLLLGDDRLWAVLDGDGPMAEFDALCDESEAVRAFAAEAAGLRLYPA